MNKLRLARNKEIVVQELGKEILIYDLKSHKAYNLNETSSTVYRACDGKTTFDEIKLRAKFTDEIIFLALEELKKENLIEVKDSYASPFAGMTRRQVIRKVGPASMIALPVVSSLIAPTAAMTASCGDSLPSNTVRGNCSAAVEQPPATLASCTTACQSAYASACASCTTYTTPVAGSPGVFTCRCT
jgi:hypothetical protein